MVFSDVLVLSAGGVIPLRFRHDDAQAFRGAIMPLIPGSGQPRVVVQHAGTQIDVADQIKKLAELRDQGVLSSGEFDAKKSQLLGL
jgi:hypothetical protein